MPTEEQQLVVSIEGRVNQLERAMQRAAKVTGDTYGGMERRAKQAAQNIDRAFANDNTRGLAEGAKLTSQQLVILNAAARDAFASIASGQSVMTTLAQQGSNVTAAFGEDGVMGLLGGIGNGLKGLVTPATAAMAAIVAVGAAGAYSLSRYQQEQLAIELALTGIGKLSGATAADIRAVGDEASKTGFQSAAAAREVATALAATGKIRGADLAGVTALAPGFAKLFGVDSKEAGARLAGIFADPSKGADELDKRLGLLDDRTRQFIRTLVEQGNRQAAIKTLIAAVTPELQAAAEKTSLWAKAWNAVANAADAASTSIGKTLSGPTLDEQLAAAKARRDRAAPGAGKSSEPELVEFLRKAGLTESQIAAQVPSYKPSLDALDTEITKLEERKRAEEELRKAKEETIRVNEPSKAAGDLVRLFNDEAESVEKLANQYQALSKALADPAVAGRIDGGAEKAAATLKALEERLEAVTADHKAGGTAAAAALRAADYNRATAGLDAYRKGLSDINRQYDEQIRLAKASGDAASQAARVATLEAARGSALDAYRTESRDRAISQTAIPSDYYNSIRSAESSGNDSARSFTGAVGRYQFIESTWLRLFEKHKGELAASIAEKNPGDKGRAAILALRNDPEFQEELVKYLTQENAAALAQAGFSSSSRNLYGAHNIGAGGITALLRAERDGQGGASAQSILDRIDPRLTSSNRAYYGNGNTVDQALAILQRKATGSSSAGRAQRDAANNLRIEADQYGKTATEAERLKSVEEQLAADRERGGELSQRFKTAQDLIKASSEQLTPALAAQREEVLKLADARAKAAATGLNSRFEADMRNARDALGRTSGEQSDFERTRGYGVDPASEAGKAMQGQLATLRAMQEFKSASAGFASGFVSDIVRGSTALQALQNQLARVADRLISMAADALVSRAFGALLGGSAGGAGGGPFSGLGKLFGFSEGGYTGPGGKYQPAGIVHAGEFVLPAHVVKRIGVPALESLRKGYADGGLVGGLPSIATAKNDALAAMGGGTTIAPQISVTVQGAAGNTASQHAETGANVAKAIERQVRAMIGEELTKARRPGGVLRR